MEKVKCLNLLENRVGESKAFKAVLLANRAQVDCDSHSLLAYGKGDINIIINYNLSFVK